ncbi:MAG TPA: family 16 glycosylhydrolase [Polyangiaceae bacterium]
MNQHPFELPFVVGALSLAMVTSLSSSAQAVSSAELYTSKSYVYGRITARIQYAAGEGVVSSFFLWKDGSEKSGVFWNELDFEKLNADCHLETNAYYGSPAAVHSKKHTSLPDICGGFHTYTYEWTPDYIAWLVDGTEIRRETGTTAAAYAENATTGMQIRFNIWPGDASFGGTFSPTILPVYEYINWVEYYSYADGAFTLAWREDFAENSAPTGWLTGNWGSPKNLSTHKAANVDFVNGYAVLALTADDALGAAGVTPNDDGSTSVIGTGGGTGAGGASSVGGSSTSGGSSAVGVVGGASAATASAAPSNDDGGCSLASSTSTRGHAFLLAMVGAILCIGRRKERRS